ncbi:hypothetical protein AX17_004057 [Amanita inopinata Kibby_2008]|nr:hypothetical protein AX17_004057 [Amanita inopinata Kibby_2008]
MSGQHIESVNEDNNIQVLLTQDDGKCPICKHDKADHRHRKVKWEQLDSKRLVMDPDAEKKYKKALEDNTFQEKMKKDLETFIADIKNNMQESLIELGQLVQSYAQLSLTGNEQVNRFIRMLETNLEVMKTNNVGY